MYVYSFYFHFELIIFPCLVALLYIELLGMEALSVFLLVLSNDFWSSLFVSLLPYMFGEYVFISQAQPHSFFLFVIISKLSFSLFGLDTFFL